MAMRRHGFFPLDWVVLAVEDRPLALANMLRLTLDCCPPTHSPFPRVWPVIYLPPTEVDNNKRMRQTQYGIVNMPCKDGNTRDDWLLIRIARPEVLYTIMMMMVAVWWAGKCAVIVAALVMSNEGRGGSGGDSFSLCQQTTQADNVSKYNSIQPILWWTCGRGTWRIILCSGLWRRR